MAAAAHIRMQRKTGSLKRKIQICLEGEQNKKDNLMKSILHKIQVDKDTFRGGGKTWWSLGSVETRHRKQFDLG